MSDGCIAVEALRFPCILAVGPKWGGAPNQALGLMVASEKGTRRLDGIRRRALQGEEALFIEPSQVILGWRSPPKPP
jgi:hypothetical protein